MGSISMAKLERIKRASEKLERDPKLTSEQKEKIYADALRDGSAKIAQKKVHAQVEATIRPSRGGQTIETPNQIVKVYKGKKHTVRTLDDGTFEYAGKKYESLTAIAMKIISPAKGSKARTSGPVFFGLTSCGQPKDPRARVAVAVERMERTQRMATEAREHLFAEIRALLDKDGAQ